jgi:Arc/MetJ family transcription regulator
MRTNMEIDEKLLRDALRATGLKTKREVIELGLRTLLRLRAQQEIRGYRGRLPWEGDRDALWTPEDADGGFPSTPDAAGIRSLKGSVPVPDRPVTIAAMRRTIAKRGSTT